MQTVEHCSAVSNPVSNLMRVNIPNLVSKISDVGWMVKDASKFNYFFTRMYILVVLVLTAESLTHFSR